MIRDQPSIHAGFSLVELMVAMVISLMTVLIIMQVIIVFDSSKRTMSSGADAQESGLISLNAMSTDVRMSGYGMITSGMLGCTSVNTYRGGASTLGALFMPVTITDGGTGPDKIASRYSGSGNGGIPARVVVAMATSDAVLTVNVSNGMNVNDIVMVSTPGSGLPCTQLQITALTPVSGGVNLIHASGAGINNPPVGTNIFPAGGYGTTPTTYLFDLGTMVDSQYQILCGTLAVTDRTTQLGAASCTNQNTFANATPLASNIVNIQAQYGLAPAASQAVNCWVNATSGNACDAGDWAAPTAANISRIKAVRIAVVARSALMEKPSTGTTCDTTTTAPVAWPGGAAVDLTADTNWKCYRYKVYETIVPLRNVVWANL